MNCRIAEKYSFIRCPFVNLRDSVLLIYGKRFRAAARVKVKFRNFLKLVESVNSATWEKS